MDHYYLGYVEFIHEALWGRIRPLALVKKRSADDAWIVDRPCKPNELGATGLVFWPKIPHDQDHLAHQYVRFKVEPNQRARESEHDEFVVAEEWQHGSLRRVSTVGLLTLVEDRVFGPDRILDPNSGLRSGVIIFRRCMKDTVIDGPWRVAEIGGPGRLCLVPKEDGYVLKYALDRLDQKTFHVWDDDERETQVVLMVEPAKADGRVIDLLPASGLAGWLIRVLNRDKPLLSSLDRASPGWRARVGELLGIASDQVQRALETSRFARLEGALDALATDEARLADLAESSRFKEILDAAISREVASARERIEADARDETRSFVAQQRQEREREKAQAEREKKALLREVDKVRTEVADAERLRDEARAKAERDESSIRAAAEHLVESRDRIIRDFSAFHELIENSRVSVNSPTNGHHPAIAKVLEVSEPEETRVAPDGPAIDDPGVFLRRLATTMAAWGAEATPLQAKRLHAALLSCRWVAAPCPSWGVAYAEAMGAHARQRIVAVEPTWLAFSDAWGGEVEAFWREAVEQRGALYLLIFADADRALVQCWARPLLDIVSGVRLALPSGLPWPDNLRVMTCPSADEASLPVPDWVVAHWAGIKAASGGTRPEGPIAPGHVPFAAWSGWVMTSDDIPRPSAGLGVAARSAARERSALARTFRRLDPDDAPDSAQEIAREIRETDARAVFKREVRA